MDKARIIEITDEIKRHFKFMKDVDENEIVTCCYCDRGEWHIYNYEDFLKICNTLGLELTEVKGYDYVIFNEVRILSVRRDKRNECEA